MSCLFNSLAKFVSDDSYRIRTRICDYLATNPDFIYSLLKYNEHIVFYLI